MSSNDWVASPFISPLNIQPTLDKNHEIPSKYEISSPKLEDFQQLILETYAHDKSPSNLEAIETKNPSFFSSEKDLSLPTSQKVEEFAGRLFTRRPTSAVSFIQSLEDVRMKNQLALIGYHKISLKIDCLKRKIEIKKKLLEKNLKLFNERELTPESSSLQAILEENMTKDISLIPKRLFSSFHFKPSQPDREKERKNIVRQSAPTSPKRNTHMQQLFYSKVKQKLNSRP